MKPSKSEIISCGFLVAGTCIGGGMLALPLVSGLSGFFPSLVILSFCAFFMGLTGLYFIEASLWMKEEVHVISMVTEVLGKWPKLFCWCMYLFVSYASLVAYGSGGGQLVYNHAPMALKEFLTSGSVTFFFILILTLFFLFGSYFLERVNAVLFLGVLGAFSLLVLFSLFSIEPKHLFVMNPKVSFLSVPLVLTAFSYQTMSPSLTPLLKRDPRALKIAIYLGMALTFLIYALWHLVVLGIIPLEGPGGIREALIKGDLPVTEYLGGNGLGCALCYLAEVFAFFAIVTSFLGIGLGLYDFLADGLKIPKRGGGALFLGLLILAPTFYFAVNFERIFIIALDITGGYGDTLLNGLIPIAMIWVGRYRQKREGALRVFGGKPLLLMGGLFFMLCFFYEVLSHAGLLTSIYTIGKQ